MLIRRPCVAGQFYPDNKDDCLEMVKKCLNNSSENHYEDNMIAGIVPHAGWVFSGNTAGKVFTSINPENPPDTFIVLGAVHRYGVKNYSVFPSGAWDTPLGEIKVDEKLAEIVLSSDLFENSPSSHDREHSIEVHLPFISYLFPQTKILPIACPPFPDSYDRGLKLAEIVSGYSGKVVVIASTDLTHYGPSYGFTPMGIGAGAQEWVKKENDGKFIEFALNLDGDAIIPYANKTQCACGSGAVACAVGFAKSSGVPHGKLLDYTNSLASGYGRGNDFVGYCSIIYTP